MSIRALAGCGLSDAPLSANDREWYVLGFEAALRGEPATVDMSGDTTFRQAEAWLRGYGDAAREQAIPSLRAHVTRKEDLQLGSGSTALDEAVAIKIARRQEMAERDIAARERIAAALEKLCAWVERLG